VRNRVRVRVRVRIRVRDGVRDRVRLRVRLFSPLRRLHCVICVAPNTESPTNALEVFLKAICAIKVHIFLTYLLTYIVTD